MRVSVGDSLLSGTPPPTVTIPAGQGGAAESEATFTVTTADDAMGTVTATVQSRLQAGYRVGSPSSANVTVTRDPVVTITANQKSDDRGRHHGVHRDCLACSSNVGTNPIRGRWSSGAWCPSSPTRPTRRST